VRWTLAATLLVVVCLGVLVVPVALRPESMLVGVHAVSSGMERA
jgi:hypothetical protein